MAGIRELMESKSPIALFVVGEPGVGKTSAIRLLLEPENALNPSPKWTMGGSGRVAAAGHYGGGKFDGADKVPYNGVAAALAFWESALSRYSLTILDGDRFSNRKVVEWFIARDVRPVVALLVGSDVAAERRLERGGGQNETWLKGRKTKSRNFADLALFGPTSRAEIEVSRSLDPGEIASAIRALIR